MIVSLGEASFDAEKVHAVGFYAFTMRGWNTCKYLYIPLFNITWSFHSYWLVKKYDNQKFNSLIKTSRDIKWRNEFLFLNALGCNSNHQPSLTGIHTDNNSWGYLMWDIWDTFLEIGNLKSEFITPMQVIVFSGKVTRPDCRTARSCLIFFVNWKHCPQIDSVPNRLY